MHDVVYSHLRAERSRLGSEAARIAELITAIDVVLRLQPGSIEPATTTVQPNLPPLGAAVARMLPPKEPARSTPPPLRRRGTPPLDAVQARDVAMLAEIHRTRGVRSADLIRVLPTEHPALTEEQVTRAVSNGLSRLRVKGQIHNADGLWKPGKG